MDVSLKSADWDIGTGVRGYVWRAKQPVGSLLLQHGYAEYAERFALHHHKLIPRLVERGFDVYAFDMRGHGRTAGVRGYLDVRDAVDDHLAARRAIGGPAFLFGHSLGGLVTVQSVLRDRRDVAGVILSAPALLVESSRTSRLLANLLSALVPHYGIAAPQPAANLSRIAEETRAFEQDELVFRGKMAARLAWSALTLARSIWHKPGAWTAPTIVFHGTADSYTDIRGSKRFVAAIGARDKLLTVVPDGRHELLNDLDRNLVLGTILEWLESRSPGLS